MIARFYRTHFGFAADLADGSTLRLREPWDATYDRWTFYLESASGELIRKQTQDRTMTARTAKRHALKWAT